MEVIDYERVIADLEDRRRAFNDAVDATITSIRTMMALGATVAVPGGPGPVEPKVTGKVAPSMLFGKSIPEAAMTVLQVFSTPMTAKEIAEALEGAKYHHESRNFVNTVNSLLNRRQDTFGDVVKLGKSWGLAEWSRTTRRARQDSE